MDIVINHHDKAAPPKSQAIFNYTDCWLNWLYCLDLPNNIQPYAALLARFHGLKEGPWLLAAPIHWEVSHNNAAVTATQKELKLSPAESLAFYEVIASFLREDGFVLHYINADTWLVKPMFKPAIKSAIPEWLLNRSLTPTLMSLDVSGYWPRLLTELQMLLSSHAYNQLKPRELTVNGIWFYGEGSFDALKKTTYTDNVQLQACFPEHVKPLDLNIMDDHAVYLIDNYQPDIIRKFQTYSKKHSTRWFWNNQAYQMIKKSWLDWLRG